MTTKIWLPTLSPKARQGWGTRVGGRSVKEHKILRCAQDDKQKQKGRLKQKRPLARPSFSFFTLYYQNTKLGWVYCQIGAASSLM
jgi:hypothetical protein